MDTTVPLEGLRARIRRLQISPAAIPLGGGSTLMIPGSQLTLKSGADYQGSTVDLELAFDALIANATIDGGHLSASGIDLNVQRVTVEFTGGP